MIKIGIVTYNRKTVKTMNILTAWKRKDIIISTQTREDYERIRAMYGNKANVIYSPADSCSTNRNNLLDYMQRNGIKECILLDDDIINIGFLRDNKLVPILPDELPTILEHLVSVARINNAPIFGFYPCYNAFFMGKGIRRQYIVIGTVFGMLNTQLRFDPSMRVKEDYELCCRVINKGYNCLRFDFLATNANHYTKGGCEMDLAAPQVAQYALWLEDLYPHLIKAVNGEVRYIGNKEIL